MTNFERQAPDATDEASELEGGGTEQTWGQGDGAHEPTIPDEDDEEKPPTTYSSGTAANLEDAGLPLAREDEGMDR